MATLLPDVNSPSIVLAPATDDEELQNWRATYPPWGPGLTLEQYIDRETDLKTTDLSRDGGLSPWILTDSKAQSPRPVLSSCETFKKRAIVSQPDGTVTDVTAHGVASVFTYTECRSRGYASRMMALLAQHLARKEAALPGSATFSVLFSDIGPQFYAKHGWNTIGNMHLEFPITSAQADAVSAASSTGTVTEIVDADLAAFAARDEELLRAQLSQPLPNGSSTTRVAVLPDLRTLQWHYRRENHMLRHFLGREPSVRGAMYTPSSPGGEARRVWCLWVRTRSGGADGHAVITIMHFLRVVVEDEAAVPDEELGAALRAIMAVAGREASDANCSSIEIWNPTPRVRAAFESSSLADLGAKTVLRGNNLPSLLWLGSGPAENVEWVANERFEWC